MTAKFVNFSECAQSKWKFGVCTVEKRWALGVTLACKRGSINRFLASIYGSGPQGVRYHNQARFIFQTGCFSAVTFTIHFENKMSFLVIPKSLKVWKKLKKSEVVPDSKQNSHFCDRLVFQPIFKEKSSFVHTIEFSKSTFAAHFQTLNYFQESQRWDPALSWGL